MADATAVLVLAPASRTWSLLRRPKKAAVAMLAGCGSALNATQAPDPRRAGLGGSAEVVQVAVGQRLLVHACSGFEGASTSNPSVLALTGRSGSDLELRPARRPGSYSTSGSLAAETPIDSPP